MKWPESQSEAFDLSSHRVEEHEVQRIREAFETRRWRPSAHALRRALDHGLSTGDMSSIVLNGEAIEKDLEMNNRDRKPGIAFVGVGPSGVRSKVKVTYVNGIGYEVVTVHPMEEEGADDDA